MIIMIAATALAAASQPSTTPAAAGSMAEHAMHGPMGQHSAAEEDCCKDCCKDMAAKHEGHAGHQDHNGE